MATVFALGALRATLLSMGLLAGACSAAAAEDVCAGRVFTVHGRLSAWNGAPTHRIWIIGTHRLLGVHAGTAMPDNLLPLTQTFDVQVVGDFVLCPVTRSRPGVMQMVRILSATKLHSQPRVTP